ncbi:Adp-ribosylation factor-like 8b [Mycena venus]|uniref:Adp-ribosylation factor-like 8b n=1 Tax=Mycena venus TaxID=2733690 RepID=A0A8H6YU76_9AGAR|nr:Adp-ribosylation factor-like 8b [Mycena venus]
MSSFFFSKVAEIAIVGLQASGKTSFVNVIGSGQWSEDVVPTVGFIYKKVRKGNVTLRIWDVAGQPKFRTMWERYCSGVDAIVFILDSADASPTSSLLMNSSLIFSSDSPRNLTQPALNYISCWAKRRSPVSRCSSFLGNKNDLEGHVPVKDLIRDLQLDKITDRPVSCYSCSMKSQHNLDIVLQWLAGRSH